MAKQSLRKRVLELDVGETISVGLGDYGYTTVRGYASELGLYLNRRYSTHRDAEKRTYTITRES